MIRSKAAISQITLVAVSGCADRLESANAVVCDLPKTFLVKRSR
jgi:hypothetical protein